jgi:GxxExxY protein
MGTEFSEGEMGSRTGGSEVEFDELSGKVIGLAIEVHRHLGPGLLETVYEHALAYELSQARIPFQRQCPLPVQYKEVHLDCGFRIDLLVDDAIIVELKSVDKLLPIHETQVLTYLRQAQKPIGLLINFNVQLLRNGLKRIVYHW